MYFFSPHSPHPHVRSFKVQYTSQTNLNFRVDLASFPRMIFELLDGCISEEQKETPNKFPVLLYSDCDLDVTFKIQETTQYNILAHLKLQLRKGNDAKVTF